MKLESILRKKESQSVAVPAIPQSNSSPAREAKTAFLGGEYAEAQRAARDAAADTEAASAEAARLEQELAQHDADVSRASDPQSFVAAKGIADFTRQKLTQARQRVSACEDQQRAIAQQFVGLEQRRRDLVVAVLMEHARQIEAELHQIEAQACERFASLTELYDHFRTEKIVGISVEELGEIFQRLRDFAIVNDAARETARASLREMLNNL